MARYVVNSAGNRTQFEAVELTRAERIALGRRLRGFRYVSGGDYAAQIHAATAAFVRLSSRLDQALDRFMNDERSPGVMTAANLPFDGSVRRGPIDPERGEVPKATSFSEGILLGLAGTVGVPYGVYQEGRSLVSNLSPRKRDADRLTGLGSRLTLDLHIEDAAARVFPGDRAPEGLVLTGVSAEPGIQPKTILADGRLALRRLDEGTRNKLREPKAFWVHVPQRWQAEGFDARVAAAVLRGPDAYPSFVAALYGHMIEPRGRAAAAAVGVLKAALEEVSTEMEIKPGVAVLINNRFVFHGRRGFCAAFDSKGRPYRWIQRVFWTTTMRRFCGWQRMADRLVSANGDRMGGFPVSIDSSLSTASTRRL